MSTTGFSNWMGPDRKLRALGWALLFFALVLRTGTLWFAGGFHVAFDHMQLFVIGTANAAQVPVARLLNVHSTGPAWLTGGVLGTEARLLMYPMLALLWFYLWWRFPAQPVTATAHTAWTS